MTYAVQLFSVRDAAKADLKATLKAVADLGFTGVEFAGFFKHGADEVKAWLSEYGLAPVGSHVGLNLLAPEAIADTVAYHKAIGCVELTVPAANWDGKEQMRGNLDALRRASAYLADNGLRLSYHNHAQEFVKAPYGATVMQVLTERTDLWLEPDIFWLYAAGKDPVAFCEAYRFRICMLHLKDGIAAPAPLTFTNANEGTIDRALGEGNAPVLPVLAWAKKNGVPVIVESEGLDPTGIAEIGRCMAFLKRQ